MGGGGGGGGLKRVDVYKWCLCHFVTLSFIVYSVWAILKTLFALYFILSRDVPILKSFSARPPKIFVCCSSGCSVVAVVAELWWPIVGCKNARRKQRIAYQTFPISKQNIKTIKVTTRPSIDVQSVQRSHNDFLHPIKHDLAVSDEIARLGSLHEFVSTVICMILWVRQSRALSLLYSFRHPI